MYINRLYLEVLSEMTIKELKTRYKKAVFGFLWLFLNPLLQMIIVGVVFSVFLKIENYFVFLFLGLLLWNFFYLSIMKATPSYIFESNLLKKAKFPKEMIPISIIMANFVHLVLSLALVCLYLLFTSQTDIKYVFLLIPLLSWLLLLTIGLSLLFSSLQVRYRDVSFFAQTLLNLWFYATPVLYAYTSVPEKLSLLFHLNPLVTIFEIAHFILHQETIISLSLVVSNLVISTIICIVGIIVFIKERDYFIDLI